MRYKIGDRVKIKSLDWYNQNKDQHGRVACGYHVFTEEMSKFCGCTMIVCNRTNLGVMTMGGSTNYWTDEMIEGLALEKGSELPSVVYIPYIIEDSPPLETSTEMCPKIELPTRYYDEVKYEPKMVSLDKVKGWIKENMYECDGGVEKWVNTYFHTFEEMFNDFNKAMEE